MTRRLLLVLLGILSALALAAPALAATTTVTLGQGGPSPSTATIKSGDTVVFSNTDGVSHVLKSTSKNWTLSATVKAGAKTSLVFSKAGTFDYSDTYNNVLGISTTSTGHVVVPAAAPSASPSASSKPSATSKPSTPAKPSASASASATAVPSASGSGVAIPPPITTDVVPTAAPTDSAGPQPQVAPSVAGTATAVASAGPSGPLGYGDPAGLTQTSPHGFGLPTALAVVAVVGVTTLLVRFLLATPEAQRPVR